MSSNGHPHALAFHPRHHSPAASPNPPADSLLPEGECTFLRSQPGRSPERCDCVAFTLDKDRPGTLCGCGHQAWNHVRSHIGDGVSRDEFGVLVHQTRELRLGMERLHDEMQKQRKERERERQQIASEFQKLFEAIAKVKMLGQYNMASSHASLEQRYTSMDQRITSVASHATHLEDRIEAVVDKTSTWDNLVKKVELLDEACMTLEDRVERIEPGPVNPGKMLSPVQEVKSQETSPVPAALDQKRADAWNIKVVLVPRKTQRFAFGHDSLEWRRCYSRGLHQDVNCDSHSAHDFTSAVDKAFKTVLQSRPWAPLVCLSSEEKALSQLPTGQHQPRIWDHAFLEKHCFAHDKLDGDIMYIAPTQDELPWSYIRSLPPVPRADESCWEYSADLDGFGGLNFSRPQRTTPFQFPQSIATPSSFLNGDKSKLSTSPSNFALRKSSIESDNTVYDNSPPPYTTAGFASTPARTYDDQMRLHNLASIALSDRGQDESPRQAGTHVFDRGLPRPSTSAGPGERPMTVPPPVPSGSEMEIDDDELQPPLSAGGYSRSATGAQRGRSSEPSSGLSRSGSGSTSHSNEKPAQQAYYFSGRSKRKVTTSKFKEPVGVSVSEMKLPKFSFHKHGTTGGGAEERSEGHAG